MARLNPRSVVRLPTVSLKEKVSPSAMRVPLMMPTAFLMLLMRLVLEDEALVTA